MNPRFHSPSDPLPRDGSLDTAPEGSFGIVVIPDTQAYLNEGDGARPTNLVFENHVRWISENLERQKLVFVSHVGDIVDRPDQEQRQLARSLMDKLHGRIPYGFSPGNKDMTPEGDSSLYRQFNFAFPTPTDRPSDRKRTSSPEASEVIPLSSSDSTPREIYVN